MVFRPCWRPACAAASVAELADGDGVKWTVCTGRAVIRGISSVFPCRSRSVRRIDRIQLRSTSRRYQPVLRMVSRPPLSEPEASGRSLFEALWL